MRNPGRPAQVGVPRLSPLGRGRGRGRSWGPRAPRGTGGRGRSGRPRRVGRPGGGSEASVRSAAGGGGRRRLWAGLGPAPGPRVGCVAQSRRGGSGRRKEGEG